MTDHVLVNDPSRGVCTCGVPTRFDRDGWTHDPQTPPSEGRKRHRLAYSGDRCALCGKEWPCADAYMVEGIEPLTVALTPGQFDSDEGGRP